MRDFNIEDHPNSLQYHLMRFMDAFGNVFALNLIFLLFSLPVVTLGASMTALYSVCLKLTRKEEPHLWKAYVKAFKENFKKATLVWLLVLAAFFVLWGDYMLINTVEGGISGFYIIVMVVEIVLLCLVLPFLFPLVARYDNTVLNYFKNSLLLAVSNLGSWIKVAMIWFAPTILSLRYPVIIISTWYLWLLVMFGLMAYISAKVINKVFEKVSDAKENEVKQNEIKNEKRRQFLNVHERATSYVNKAEDEEEANQDKNKDISTENDKDIESDKNIEYDKDEESDKETEDNADAGDKS